MHERGKVTRRVKTRRKVSVGFDVAKTRSVQCTSAREGKATSREKKVVVGINLKVWLIFSM